MKKRKIISAFLVRIAITLIICSSAFIMFNILVTNTHEFQTTNISTLKDAKFDAIIKAIDSISERAYDYLIPLSSDLEKEIRENCDMDQLEQDLNNGIINEDFQAILKKHTFRKYFSNLENDKNDIFIANHDKILADFSHDTTYDKKVRTWEEEIKSFANPISAKNALHKLYIQNDGIIIWEREESTNENHTYFNNITEKTMRKVYYEEGLEGLKNYQILVPVYITTDGDIFGKPDIKNGIRIQNNKIIVIQEFNIYEQLEKEFPELLSEKDLEKIESEYEHMMMHLHTFGVAFIVAIIGVIVTTCNKFNSTLEQEENDDKEEPK